MNTAAMEGVCFIGFVLIVIIELDMLWTRMSYESLKSKIREFYKFVKSEMKKQGLEDEFYKEMKKQTGSDELPLDNEFDIWDDTKK